MPDIIDLGKIDPTIFLKKDINTLSESDKERNFVLAEKLATQSDPFFPASDDYEITLKSENDRLITYKFSLTHPIFRRLTKQKKERYEIIDKDDDGNLKKLGEGQFGSVYKIAGTLVRTQEGYLVKKITKPWNPSKPRNYVVKQQANHPSVSKEIELAKKTRHLHIKDPVIAMGGQVAYTAMKELRGIDLQTYFEEIYTEELNTGKKTGPTDLQKFNLSILLFRALQEQVHDNDIIHQDIKPTNILYDEESNKIKILDFGLSKKKDEHPEDVGGTVDHIPIEQFLKRFTDEKSDAYSMWVVLMQLWQIQKIETCYPYRFLDEESFNLLPINFQNLSYERYVLDQARLASLPVKLKKLFERNVNDSQGYRQTPTETIKSLEELRIDYLISKVEQDNLTRESPLSEEKLQQLCQNMRDANIAALSARDKLRLLALNPLGQNSLEKISTILQDALKEFNADDGTSLNEFVGRLGIKAFIKLADDGQVNKETILEMINDTIDAFAENTKKLLAIEKQIEESLKFHSQNPYVNIRFKEAANDLLKETGSILGKHKKFQVTFDDVISLNKRYQYQLQS